MTTRGQQVASRDRSILGKMERLYVPDRFFSRDVQSGTLAGCLTFVLTVFDSGQIYRTLLTCLSWVSSNRATESLRLPSTQADFLGARPSIYFLLLLRLASEDIGSVKLMKVCL